jgi:hypothetical protein
MLVGEQTRTVYPKRIVWRHNIRIWWKQANAGGAPQVDAGDAPKANAGGAPKADTGEAAKADVGGAPKADVGGAPKARKKVARGERVARCPWIKRNKNGGLKGRQKRERRRVFRPCGAASFFTCDPGAACSASLRTGPWLPSCAPAALAIAPAALTRRPTTRAAGSTLESAPENATASECRLFPVRRRRSLPDKRNATLSSRV